MTIAYIRSLEQAVTRSQPSQLQSLRDKLLAWYRGLPAVSRDRRFSMSEIQSALNTPGQVHQPPAAGARLAPQTAMEHDGPVPSLLGAANHLGVNTSLTLTSNERPELYQCPTQTMMTVKVLTIAKR